MRTKEYAVELTDSQRADLVSLVKTGEAPARTIWHAQVLLLSADGKNDSLIAEVLHIAPITVKRIRKRFCTAGLDAALHDKPRPGVPPKLDGDQQAAVVALACTDPPSGYARWTLRLLADRLVQMQIVDSLSDETVRRVLKKTSSNPGAKSSGVSHL